MALTNIYTKIGIKNKIPKPIYIQFRLKSSPAIIIIPYNPPILTPSFLKMDLKPPLIF